MRYRRSIPVLLAPSRSILHSQISGQWVDEKLVYLEGAMRLAWRLQVSIAFSLRKYVISGVSTFIRSFLIVHVLCFIFIVTLSLWLGDCPKPMTG